MQGVEVDEKPNISNETIAAETIEIEAEEIAPSSTSLERSILLDQNSVVECEAVDDGDEDDDDLYHLLNIEKRTTKPNELSIESISAGAQAGAIPSDADLAEVPSQSNSHACNECGKNFNRSGNLRRHQEAVHGTITLNAKNPKGN